VLNANKEEEPVDKIEVTPVLDKVSSVEVKKAMDKIIRFLYEQEEEFGEVSNELKVLRGYVNELKF